MAILYCKSTEGFNVCLSVLCTLQVIVGNAYYTCTCVRYVTPKVPEVPDPPATSDNRWLIIGISVGCGLLLIIIIIVIIIVVVCCRRRDEPVEAKAYKDNDSIELEQYDSIDNYDCYKAEDKYYATIGDDTAYCSPGVVQPEEFKPYSALELPELPERLPKPAEEAPETTAGDTSDASETEPTGESSPYYLTLVEEPSVC